MIEQLVESLKKNKFYKKRISYVEILPEHKPKNCQLKDLNPILDNYLKIKNIQPYLHQCQTYELVKKGFNVILTTSTASGKTLAYNLPVFENLIENPKSTALYIYPAKALSNDQLKVLKDFEKISKIVFNPAVYDGDTPSEAKSIIREHSRIVLTNPYELHNILPWAFQWTNFFSNLKFIVLDEAHQYRGVFGSNIAFVIRRLKRILDKLGSKPQFILSSATLSNPLEFAYKLTGEVFQLVNNDGSPKGRKFFVFYNPFFNPQLQASPVEHASRLFANFVYNGLKTLVFTRSRKSAEILTRITKELLAKKFPDLANKITSYRAGYLPSERRSIENDFKSGKLLGLASTNALELGIDIGDLDAVIIVGFPGTIISTMQQSGRAGRKANESLTVFVAFNDKLDQYFVKYPKQFFLRPFENAIIDLENPYILSAHLLCASAEMPITDNDKKFFYSDDFQKILTSFEQKNLVKKTQRGYIYIGKVQPTQIVSLNGVSADNFKIVYNGRLLEIISKNQAFREAHQDAVFFHQADTFIVKNFDLNKKIIDVVKKDVDYYTVALKTVDAEIIQTLKQRKIGDYTIYFGKLNVVEVYDRYSIKRGNETIGYGNLNLPPLEFETKGIWLTISEKILDKIWKLHPEKKASIPSEFKSNLLNINTLRFDVLAGGLHGAEHALIGVMPFVVMADRWDLGGFSTLLHKNTGLPSIFIYDAYQGGIGICEKTYDIFEQVAFMAFRIVDDCKCKNGCPACIMSPKCGNDNRPLDKYAAKLILKYLYCPNCKL